MTHGPLKWTPEAVVRAIRQIGPKRFSIARDHHAALFAAARMRFGTWQRAIEEAGFSYPAEWRLKKWSRKAILSAIRDRARQKLALNCKFMRRHVGGLFFAGKRDFGTWQAAVRAAGKGHLLPPPPPKAWTRTELLGHLKALARKHGFLETRLLGSATRPGYSTPASAIRTHFGTLTCAKKLAGLESRPRRSRKRILG